MARKVAQPGGGNWVVRTNPVEAPRGTRRSGIVMNYQGVAADVWTHGKQHYWSPRPRNMDRNNVFLHPRGPVEGPFPSRDKAFEQAEARAPRRVRNPAPTTAPNNLASRLPLDLAILLAHARQAGARVELRATEVAEGAFRGEPGRGRYVRAIDVAVRPPRAHQKMAETLAAHGFRRVENAWTLYVQDRGVRHNPAPTPALRALLKAHGFKATKDGWTTHLPAMDVSIRSAARKNPGTVSPYQLRAGDTIELPDLGRMHVIQGPYRSGRGIRFINEYGNSLLLAPNEAVRVLAHENPSSVLDSPEWRFNSGYHDGARETLRHRRRDVSRHADRTYAHGYVAGAADASVGRYDENVRSAYKARGARKNPSVREGTRVGTLQQRVERELDYAGLLRRGTRFRETSGGGLQVTGLDVYALGAQPEVLLALKHAARVRGFEFRIGGDGLLMLPPGVAPPAPRADDHAFDNPRKRRRTARR